MMEKTKKKSSGEKSNLSACSLAQNKAVLEVTP
jgi:hypothetical protein